MGIHFCVFLLTHTVTHNRMNHDGGERSGYEPLPSFGGYLGFYFWLHDLGHEVAHGFCCLILDLSGGVGVGTEGEASIVMA